MRLYLYFIREIMLTNLLFSLIGSFLVQSGNILPSSLQRNSLWAEIRNIITAATVIFTTTGFLFALFLYFMFHKHEIPLYYNKNISLRTCIVIAYSAHCLIGLVILFITGLCLNAVQGTK